MKTLFLIILGFSTMFFQITETEETTLDNTWKTVCEFKLDGYMTQYTGIVNTGDNAATDCQVQTWDGDSWEPSGITITGCSSLASKARLLWSRETVTPNNHFRIQMKSSSGTTVECALYRRR